MEVVHSSGQSYLEMVSDIDLELRPEVSSECRWVEVVGVDEITWDLGSRSTK